MSPLLRVHVHEPGVKPGSGWVPCKIGEHVRFSTEELASYCFAEWEPVVFDALLVAAVVEFCDRSQRRATHHWVREFHVRIPVHEPRRWEQVGGALHEALSFLTGDRWAFEFSARKKAEPSPMQRSFVLPSGSRAVIAFSEGLDSRAVAGLMQQSLGDKLLRVRLGAKATDLDSMASYGQLLASVPYGVHPQASVESSARARGFKFATISGLSAYLTTADRIIVPESGQGALGPALIPVGQAYEDYRNHPAFTDLMEAYLSALLNYQPHFEFPRLWYTKGETLKEFVDTCKDAQTWEQTRSCWQSARQVSVDGRKRQCGICAACMLRRQTVHAAGLTEAKETYVWENLAAAKFEQGAAKGFDLYLHAQREYAIAGTLHLDHLAALRSSAPGCIAIDLCAFQLARSLRIPEADAKAKLGRMLSKHETEWGSFVKSLGKRSFIADWAAHLR
ncbi:MAG: 7-cyano-7-deazaguanine synthase [Pseudomonadota bacterium]